MVAKFVSRPPKELHSEVCEIIVNILENFFRNFDAFFLERFQSLLNEIVLTPASCSDTITAFSVSFASRSFNDSVGKIPLHSILHTDKLIVPGV